ncbi:helix-turn-helix domain-containing protein [Streptomyces sp. NPDC046197]|uniref:helix-turn-helix domain-containing protein n=1 Tax=Streptomyces sp. NPDC046197 TaxID=3154337 RepID=UPI0033CC5BBE
MILPDKPIDARYLTQDDRIAIADAVHAGRSAAAIADELGKHRSTIYRELKRGRKADGSYNPWWAHNQAILRRRRPKIGKNRSGERSGRTPRPDDAWLALRCRWSALLVRTAAKYSNHSNRSRPVASL